MKLIKKKVNKAPTGLQKPTTEKLTIQFLSESKLLDRYSPKIELKFSADLRFAVFFKFANPINLLQKTVIRKTIYPHLLDELLKLLERRATYYFGQWVSIGQIFNNVYAQKKTAAEFPCGLNSVEKFFPEVGSFSGVIRVHVVIF